MKKLFVIIAAALPFLAACSAEPQPAEPGVVPGTTVDASSFRFNLENVESESRTVLTDAFAVEWVAGDKVGIFSNGTNQMIQAVTGGAHPEFEGEIAAASRYYAVYPYSESATIDGNVISTVIPNCQKGVKDGFDPAAALAVASSTNGVFNMKNVTALVRLHIGADVTSVTVANQNGTGIAGNVNITVGNDGVPATSASAASVLLIPEGDTFEEGEYYVAVAPGTLSGGLRVIETKSTNNKLYIAESDNVPTFVRSRVMTLRNLEASLVETATTVLTVNFVDDPANPTAFVNPFVEADGTTAYAFPGSNQSQPVTNPEVVCFVSGNSYYQYRFYSEYGVTANTTAGLRFGRTAGDYLETFAINGQKLVAVSIVTGNASTHGYPALCDASGNVMNGGDAFQQQLPQGKKIVWTNLDGAAATNYYLKTTQSVNQVTMRQLTFYYTGTAAATPRNARTLAPVVDGTTVTLNGQTNRNSTSLGGWDSYSAKFQYKAVSADWASATEVDLGTLGTLKDKPSYALGTLASGKYDCRLLVSCGDVTVVGNAVTFVTGSFNVNSPEYVFSTFNSSFPTYYDNVNVPYILNGSWNSGLISKKIPVVELGGNNNHNTLYAYVKGGVGVRYVSGGYSFGGNAQNPIEYAYFVLPALNGLKLAEVTATMSSSSAAGSWAVIESALDGTTSDVTGGDAVAVAKGVSPGKFTLSGTAAGKAYKLYFTGGAGTVQLADLTVKYSGTELPTVQYVCPPAVNGNGVRSLVYVNSVCANVHLTCGIRYKAGGSGNWIDLPCTLATISGGVTTVSTSSPVSIGDVVAVWVNDGAKTMYSPEVTVQASDFADPEYAFPAINSNFPLHYDNANVPYILSGTVNTALIGKQLPIVTLNGNHNTLYAHVDGGVGVRYLSKGYTLAGNATSSPISDVYFVLPALNGLTLTEVTATMGGDSQAGSWAVIESELGDVTGGDAVAVAKGASPAKFTLSGTTAGKAYKLYFTGAGTAQLAGLTVKYSGTELPTVQYVCKPVVSGSGISTVVYVNWACTNADLTGGYQYKAGGAGDWVNLNPSAFSALDKGVSTLSTARTLNAGDVVRAWASDGTKTVYSVEVTVE